MNVIHFYRLVNPLLLTCSLIVALAPLSFCSCFSCQSFLTLTAVLLMEPLKYQKKYNTAYVMFRYNIMYGQLVVFTES